MTVAKENSTNPFVSTPEGGDTTVSAEDMMKLLESFKIDTSDVELQTLLQRAKNGERIERDTLMNTVATLLSDDSKHLDELAGTIGDFQIEFR
ncbi:hypothetical protein BD770DRAFT_362306 [Pilaira anomala]|nr:hypothetical protein BD770DRAFT_362306 [Pilaira anomala]